MNIHGDCSRSRSKPGSVMVPLRAALGRGFTLIELMIVVAVIAILASLALVSYRKHVLHANRNAAEDVMLGIASAEERYLIDNRGYVASATSVGYPASDSNYTYAVTLGAGAPPSYSVTATATGNQANDTGCTTLTLGSDGTKTPSLATSNCWK